MAKIVLNSCDRTTSNTEKVDDLDAVQAILGEYEIDGDILLRPDEDGPGGMIRIRAKNTWPKAVMYDECPSPDGDDGDDDESWVLFEEGDEGFLDLLGDLGPHLETPLEVQAVMIDGYEFVAAKEWTVRPGAKEIETKTIDKLSDDSRHRTVSVRCR